ncbi:MAG TPA: hypothetical protein PLI09_18885 [Candidatus Hydrogenedentes bacterium]|nr:hypothetical protein [Candidatus Hydrogenedentota bacterium]
MSNDPKYQLRLLFYKWMLCNAIITFLMPVFFSVILDLFCNGGYAAVWADLDVIKCGIPNVIPSFYINIWIFLRMISLEKKNLSAQQMQKLKTESKTASICFLGFLGFVNFTLWLGIHTGAPGSSTNVIAYVFIPFFFLPITIVCIVIGAFSGWYAAYKCKDSIKAE